MKNRVKVRVPASTANIGPGFDILGLAVSLYNTLEVEKRDDSRLSISYKGEGQSVIPLDDSNMIFKSIKKVFDLAKIPFPGLDIYIDNTIPLMGGLGSSSSAIVSGILAGNELTGLNLDKQKLLELAVEEDGHPDNVTPALMGGFTFSYIKNDGKPAVIELKYPQDLDFIAITPDFHVSTNEARKIMPKEYPTETVIANSRNLYRLIHSLETNQFKNLKDELEDSVHQPYRYQLVPGFKESSEIAYKNGALGAFISGSGPTLGVFARENHQDIINAVQKHFKNQGLKSTARILKVDNDGAITIE